MLIPDEATSLRVAACITGLQRGLLERPVIDTLHSRVVVPLQRRNLSVDVFLAVVVPNHKMAADQEQLRMQVHDAYSPRSVVLMPLNETETFFRSMLNPRCPIRHNATWANVHGDLSVLTQWYAVQRCFETVVKAEQGMVRPYSWILRLRTDLVYHADVPLADAALSSASVYVSSSGMTNDPMYRCMNDQIFICARQLCRPYFALLELWQSPHCNATSSEMPGAPQSIFATSLLGPNGVDGPPTAPYTLPDPPPERRRAHMSAQWYFYARYSLRQGQPCHASETTQSCCGLVREVSWPYSIARGRSSLECQFRLGEYPARRPVDKDFHQRPNFYANTSALMQRCRNLQSGWRRSRRQGTRSSKGLAQPMASAHPRSHRGNRAAPSNASGTSQAARSGRKSEGNMEGKKSKSLRRPSKPM